MGQFVMAKHGGQWVGVICANCPEILGPIGGWSRFVLPPLIWPWARGWEAQGWGKAGHRPWVLAEMDALGIVTGGKEWVRSEMCCRTDFDLGTSKEIQSLSKGCGLWKVCGFLLLFAYKFPNSTVSNACGFYGPNFMATNITKWVFNVNGKK